MYKMLQTYNEKENLIKSRLNEFKNVKEKEYFHELLFCLLTPQSQAKKCWQAVEKIKQLKKLDEKSIKEILKTHTRFHNNKTRYVLEAKKSWNTIKNQLDNSNIVELRNWLAENVNGIGLKESSHFLRNIGKSHNKISILDRHILRNLKKHDLIEEEKIKNKKHYKEIESVFLNYANKMKIPADELDLLWWSNENGEIFK